MTPPVGPRIDLRPLFAPERAARHELLTSLTPEQWSAPTACPGWDVHDVVAHLLNDHVRRLSAGRDGYAGAVFADDESLPEYLDRVNDEFVRAMRQASPRVLVDQLAALGADLDALWSGVDLDAAATIDVSWAGGSSPAWLDVAREYSEFWVHQQQLRDATGRPGADTPELMAPALDTLARALPHALREHERPEGTVVTLVATGPSGGRWSAIREPGRWALGEPITTAAATVTLDQGDLWRLGSRGISATQARARASTDGDPELVAATTSLLAIVA